MAASKPAKQKRKTALQRHMSDLGKKGGRMLLKKRGKEYYREIANKRWKNKKKLPTAAN